MGERTLSNAGCNSAPTQLTLRERLIQEKQHHEARVTELNKAITALEKVPEIESLVQFLRGY